MNRVLAAQLKDWKAKHPAIPAHWQRYIDADHEPGKLDPREFGRARKWDAPEKPRQTGLKVSPERYDFLSGLRDLSKQESRQRRKKAA